MKIIKFCIENIQSKYKITLYILIYVLYSLLTLTLPYLTGKLIDILVYSQHFDLLLIYCSYISVISILRLLISYGIGMLYTEMFISSSYGISRLVINHIHNCPVSKTDRIDPAYYNQRISQDAGVLVDFSVSTIAGMLMAIMDMFISIIIIFVISPLILLTTGILLCIYIIIYWILKKSLYERGKLSKEDQAVYFSKMYEQLHYTKFVKAHSLKEFFLDRLHYAFSSFKKSYIKHQKISILLRSLDGIILAISQIILYAIGGYWVMKKNMTIGSFTLISNFFSKLVGTASFFFSLGNSYQSVLISYNRITEILTWGEESVGKTEPDSISSITLSNLSFVYGDNSILRDINMEFVKGKMYVISGKNGSGKSTLLQLILGLYGNEFRGSIKINGIPIEDINMVALRGEKIGYIEQEPLLFSDTIKKNTILWKDAHPENYDCVRALNIIDFVSHLSEGWDSVITSKNNNLSGGEKQRIALARILINKSDVMVFDEPTSALDKNIIDSLKKYIFESKKDKIVIIVTHDDRIIDICDEIIYL